MFVGIDLGTSSVKTILIDENQKTLSTHTENTFEGYFPITLMNLQNRLLCFHEKN